MLLDAMNGVGGWWGYVFVSAAILTAPATVLGAELQCTTYNWKGNLWKSFVPENHSQTTSAKYVGDAPGKAYLHSSLLQQARANHRVVYRKIVDDITTIQQTSYHDDIAYFGPAVVTGTGLLYLQHGCVTTANGACFFADPGHHKRTLTDDIRGNLQPHANVVSVAMPNGMDVYHWVMECLSALEFLVTEEATSQDFVLHVAEKSSFVMQWLDIIFPDLPPERVVSGAVHATRRLVVPQMHCGKPTAAQLGWLQRRVRTWMATHDRKSDAAMARPRVLVTRTKSRTVPGWSKLMQLGALATNGPPVDFTDGRALPSVATQLSMFNTDLVVAPHGAGLVNLIATPATGCVVEVHPLGWEDFNLCYLRIAYLLGVTYVGVSVRAVDDTVTTTVANAIKEHCRVP
eukprot:m.329161 g.329161  ORF g.329161 m.329161 type:complete len:402 (-) comp20440_c0_seq3:307-1512(-)